MTSPTSVLLSSRKGVVASSVESTSFPATNVVDGNRATRWASILPGRDVEWLIINLGRMCVVTKMNIYWEAAYAKDYVIQTAPSTSGPWTTVATRNSSDGGVDVIGPPNGSVWSVPTVKTQYLRMYMTRRGTSWGYSIFEWEIYGYDVPTPTPIPTPTPTPSGTGPSWDPNGPWTKVFEDDFASFNSATWERGWFGESTTGTGPVTGYETAKYYPANVSVVANAGAANGMVLQLHLADSTHTGFVSTRLGPHFGPGAFEARMFLPASGTSVANWPAWWTDTVATWPVGGEFDIMEGLSGTAKATYHGPNGTTSSQDVNHAIGSRAGMAGGWHTFGMHRTLTSVAMYYDGTQVGSTYTFGTTAPRPADAPHMLILGNQSGSLGGPHVYPSDMLVDWVRVWK